MLSFAVAKVAPHFDVIVIGAGPAGLVAAIQSARHGARTLLVEKSALLGGATVLNRVNLPGLFHAWGRQVIAGIGWELIEGVVAEDRVKLPDFSKYQELPHWRLQIPVNAFTYASHADCMLSDSGCDVLLHTLPAQIRRHKRKDYWLVRLCGKEGLWDTTGTVVIDCSGDANAVQLAGFALLHNRRMQPGTLVFSAGGYELETLNLPLLERAFEEAVVSGEMRRSDFLAEKNPVESFLFSRGNNSIHVPGIDATTSRGKTEAEFEARAATGRIQKFLRKQPGLAKFHVSSFASECGIRETRVIDGEIFITLEDYTSGRIWADSLCHSFYPIDIHCDDGVGIKITHLAEGVVPTIPLGALLPKGARNLIVAGRCVSSAQGANSACRVQASCMAMGQVAGAVAALATSLSCEIRAVPLGEIESLLLSHRAIVPDRKLHKEESKK